MESQHELSTSMLDLRSQFSQMSRLMQDLSNKLEINLSHRAAEKNTKYRTNTASTRPQQASAAVHSPHPAATPPTEATATDCNDGTDASVSSRHSASSDMYSQTSSQVSRQETSTMSSTESVMDEVSVADTSNCPSPTKKKHRSSPVLEETTGDSEEEKIPADNTPRTRTIRHSMVSTNLGTRFESVKKKLEI